MNIMLASFFASNISSCSSMMNECTHKNNFVLVSPSGKSCNNLVHKKGCDTRPTVCIQVAQSPQFPEGIRQLAAEFLVCLCEAREKAPGMMRKLPQYISQLFSCMLLFLLDVTVRPWLSPQNCQSTSEYVHHFPGQYSSFGFEGGLQHTPDSSSANSQNSSTVSKMVSTCAAV